MSALNGAMTQGGKMIQQVHTKQKSIEEDIKSMFKNKLWQAYRYPYTITRTVFRKKKINVHILQRHLSYIKHGI